MPLPQSSSPSPLRHRARFCENCLVRAVLKRGGEGRGRVSEGEGYRSFASALPLAAWAGSVSVSRALWSLVAPSTVAVSITPRRPCSFPWELPRPRCALSGGGERGGGGGWARGEGIRSFAGALPLASPRCPFRRRRLRRHSRTVLVFARTAPSALCPFRRRPPLPSPPRPQRFADASAPLFRRRGRCPVCAVP